MALRLTGSIDFLTGAITTDQHGVYSGSFSGSGHITSASYAANSGVSTSTLTASYVAGANVDGTVSSASYALTASHALNGGGGGGGFPYTGSAEITGSFGVTGSARIKNEVTTGGSVFTTPQWNDPSTNASFPSSPFGNSYQSSFAAAGCDITKTLVVAGIDSNFNTDQTTYTYNGSSWSTLSGLPTSYNGQASMTGDCDDAIIGCDYNNMGNYLSYDGSTNTWAFISVPPICCGQPSLVGNCNNGALQYGGQDTQGISSNEAYCWNNNSWSLCTFLPYSTDHHLFAGNPSDAVALGGYNSTLPNSQNISCHINWNGVTWNTCAPFNFLTLNIQNGPRQGLTGCTSPSLLYANPGFNAAYDGTTWNIAPSGGTILSSTWLNSCSLSQFWLTGDNTCALGFWNSSYDIFGNQQYGLLTKYCIYTPPITPPSIWCTPSSPTLNDHGTTTLRIEGGLAGCSSAALVYGGRDTNFNNVSSAEFYNGSTWSPTSNGPATKRLMIGGGSANESIWVGGQDFNNQSDHFEYNSGTWSVCAFTPFTFGTEGDMGAGSQPAFKIVGCQGHYDWNGSSWITCIPNPVQPCYPSGFGTQNDFLQVGGQNSNFNSTTDAYKWDGVTWNACNFTPWATECGGGAGSVSNGLIYNYSNTPQANNIQERGVAALAWNGSTWSSDAPSNLTADMGYTSNSNSALTPDTAMVFGVANCMNLQVADEPRCSNYFTTYTTNVSGGGVSSICDVAKFEDGMVVLPLIQSTYNFIDDAAAATGGVPLGGLYRNGSDIKIRLT